MHSSSMPSSFGLIIMQLYKYVPYNYLVIKSIVNYVVHLFRCSQTVVHWLYFATCLFLHLQGDQIYCFHLFHSPNQ